MVCKKSLFKSRTEIWLIDLGRKTFQALGRKGLLLSCRRVPCMLFEIFYRWSGMNYVFCSLVSPFEKTSFSPEDVCKLTGPRTAQQTLVGVHAREVVRAQHHHGLSRCRLWTLGKNQLCSLILVPHPPTLHRAFLSQLLSGLFPTGSMDGTTSGLGPVAVPRPPLSQTQPNLSPLDPHMDLLQELLWLSCPKHMPFGTTAVFSHVSVQHLAQWPSNYNRS